MPAPPTRTSSTPFKTISYTSLTPVSTHPNPTTQYKYNPTIDSENKLPGNVIAGIIVGIIGLFLLAAFTTGLIVLWQKCIPSHRKLRRRDDGAGDINTLISWRMDWPRADCNHVVPPGRSVSTLAGTVTEARHAADARSSHSGMTGIIRHLGRGWEPTESILSEQVENSSTNSGAGRSWGVPESTWSARLETHRSATATGGREFRIVNPATYLDGAATEPGH